MYLVVSFAFNMYFVFRTLFKIYTVFITGINTNLPANKTPVMEVDSEIVLNLFLALATESVKSMVVVVIFLNIVDNLLTLSDDDTDWVIVLNDAYSLETESDVEIDSEADLTALYNLETLSDIVIAGAVMVLTNVSIDEAESVNDMD